MYYTVEALFWRRKIGNKLDNWNNGIDFSDALVKIKKEFHDSSPIEARKNAFNCYQSIIDVLYDGLGKDYIDDYHARKDLQYYLDSENSVELMKDDPSLKFKVSDDIFNGIEVYMVMDKSYRNVKNKRDNKYCIHGIRYLDYVDRLDEDIIDSLENLFIENKFYEKFDYSFDKEIELKHFGAIGGNAEFLLKTPFDWDKFMVENDGTRLL
jgi:hypothetical protein